MKKSEISFINVILCLLVIFIHVISDTIETIGTESVVVYSLWRISCFAVYGFVFLSGLKNNLSEKFSLRRFYTRRFTKILIPYIIWVCAYYAAYCVCGRYDKFSAVQLLGFIVRGDAAAHFYFVIVIIQFYLLMPLWRIICRKVSAAAAVSAAALITAMSQESLNGILGFFLPWDVDLQNGFVFTSYLVFWIAGCYCGMHYDAFISRVRKNRWLIAAIFAVLAAAECATGYANTNGADVPAMIEMHILYFLSAIAALAALSLGRGGSRVIQSLDGASYYIYLSHCLVLYLARLWADTHVTGVWERFVVTAVPTVVISVVLCVAYSEIKRKIFMRHNN